ncbi:MAG: hypothetical protein IT343_13190 [Candidatus Melainabacteria bacterium]|jgi:hypothetical protein|nr:hypothetical protein [Candidatus Melainabacteria bacterium]
MKQIFQEIVNAKIQWEETSGPFFQTRFKDKIVTLRMNDFPDEVLWTLIIDSEELDLEETPTLWTLPPEPEEVSADVMRSA